MYSAILIFALGTLSFCHSFRRKRQADKAARRQVNARLDRLTRRSAA